MQSAAEFERIRELCRELFQLQGRELNDSTQLKIIEAATKTGIREIEVTGIVSSNTDWLQNSRALLARLEPAHGVIYRVLYLKHYGLTGGRGQTGVLDYDVVDPEAVIHLAATPNFLGTNYGYRSIDDALDGISKWCRLFNKHLPEESIGVRVMLSTVWGTRPKDPADPETAEAAPTPETLAAICHGVQQRIEQFAEQERYKHLYLEELTLADTDGLAQEETLRSTLCLVRETLPNTELGLHLHSSDRALAEKLILAALEYGVRIFDSTLGGYGGCPNAKGIGNIATEHLVEVLHREGYETGVSLSECEAAANNTHELLAALDCVT